MAIKMIGPAGAGGIVQGASGKSYTVASDGTINNVDGADVLPLTRSGWSLAGLETKQCFVEAALPADLVSVKAAATPANGAIAIAAQPAHARKLQIRTVLGTPGTTNITAGTLTLVGLDQDGNAITEVINLAAGGAVSLTQTSKYAYASLTSGTVAAYAANGAGTGNTLGIGVSNAFGVPTCTQPSTPVNLVCTKVTKATKVLGTSITAADDVAATAVVDSVARTITPTTAPAALGLVDFTFNYAFNAAA